MIEARLGQTESSISSLSRAIANGKLEHLCLLQQAYAYLNDTPPNKAKARACLDESEAKTPDTDLYYYKHVSEIRRVRNRIAY